MNEEVVPVLRVADAGRAVEWYGRLGFRKEWEHQFEPGFPWFVSVARGDVRLYLSEHTGDAPPGSLVHLYVATSTPSRPSSGSRSTRRGSPAASATSRTRTATGCGSLRGTDPSFEPWSPRP